MDIEKLWEIQLMEIEEEGMDKSLRDESEKKAKIAKFEKKISNDERLKDVNKAEYDKLKKDLLRKNHDLKALEEEHKSLNKRLYGGEIKNVKEIENANTKISSMQKQISSLEEDIIGMMDKEEKVKAEFAKFCGELDELKQKFQRYCNHHRNAVKKLENEKKKIATRKKEIINDTDPVLWKRYQALRAEKKKPVALLMDGICQGCNLSVSLGNYNRAKDSSMIMRCENCGRILYAGKKA